MQRKDLDQWWRSAVIYQVYPRSFADTNNDGIGDLPGIIERLPYLENLGVDALWISPFYPSPQCDAGYDVADYTDINPEYGTLADFDRLVEQAHARSMRVIIDVVPNHSSIKHPWFEDALAAGPNSPERARYIFRHSPDGPPNNWGSMFGGSAWSKVRPLTGKDEDEDWWYLHLFDSSQPDFDWSNPEVHELFKNYFRFWLDRGADGFRVDVAHGMVKVPGLPDDTVGPDRWTKGVRPESYLETRTMPYFDQDGVHDIFREWRQVLNEYGPDRMLVAEAWVEPPSRGALYVREDEMSQSFNFDYLKSPWDANHIRKVIDQSRREMGAVGAPVTWVLSNHDVVRHASRYGYRDTINREAGIGPRDPQPDRELGLARALAATTFMLALPGSAYIYQGEELGLPEHTQIADADRQDPTFARTGGKIPGRDGCRVPLPWHATAPNYGFGTGSPWLPQPDYWGNYAADREDADPTSTLNHYRKALKLRRELGLGTGDFRWVDSLEGVLVFENKGVTVALNFTDQEWAVQVSGNIVLAAGKATMGAQLTQLTLGPNSAAWVK
ncbi:MAG: glycoside hydrolase family 13 protein [Actinomycetaceae bacterium]|nr:glycoside hydrolase family 13 protein [Actinomycetaceae bacterium]